MWPLRRRQVAAPAPREPAPRDPAPSRLAYRLHRLWLTPMVRLMARVVVPMALAAGLGLAWLGDGAPIRSAQARLAELRATLAARPEFAINLMAIDGASDETARQIRARLPIRFPVSRFDVDLDLIRGEIAELDRVRKVSVRIRPGGVLQVDVVERVPVALWRAGRGPLVELDAEGNALGEVANRADRPALLLIAGAGAQDRVAEALELARAARPLGAEALGLVRVGQRRWDIALTGGRRIMLPEEAPVAALEQVIALDQAQDLISRAIVAIDMRLSRRPTLRLAEPAAETLHQIKILELGDASHD